MSNQAEDVSNWMGYFFAWLQMVVGFIGLQIGNATSSSIEWINQNAGFLGFIGMVISMSLTHYYRTHPVDRRGKKKEN